MDFDTATLPDDPESLKKMFIRLQGDFKDLQERYNRETDILLEQIRHLRNQLFGRKSEQGSGAGQIQPLPLFDLPEPDPR